MKVPGTSEVRGTFLFEDNVKFQAEVHLMFFNSLVRQYLFSRFCSE